MRRGQTKGLAFKSSCATHLSTGQRLTLDESDFAAAWGVVSVLPCVEAASERSGSSGGSGLTGECGH